MTFQSLLTLKRERRNKSSFICGEIAFRLRNRRRRSREIGIANGARV